MSRSRSLALVVAAALTASLAPVAAGLVPAAQGTPQPNLHAEGMHGIVHARGAGATRSGSANMTWHNGAVMTFATVTPIFSGAKWGIIDYVDDKIEGINSFYAGVGGTAYMRTNVEYSGTYGQVTESVKAIPSGFPDLTGVGTKAPSTSVVLDAVRRALKANGQTPPADGTGYYPVYSDIKRGSAGYCAWHSYGTIDGIDVQFGFFFDLAGDAGCDPKATDPGKHMSSDKGLVPNSQPLAALANVSGHELSEAVTDPRNGGWYDRQGAENSDKCAWTFGSGLITFPGNGSTWKIQGNWSNAAYSSGASTYGVRGCIDKA